MNRIKLFSFAIIISLTACTSNQKTEKVETDFLENISPGSAIGKFILLDFAEKSPEVLIHVELKEILGYGAVTNLLDNKSKFEFKIQKDFIDINRIKVGAELILEIHQLEEQMIDGGNESSNNKWEIIRILKQ